MCRLFACMHQAIASKWLDAHDVCTCCASPWQALPGAVLSGHVCNPCGIACSLHGTCFPPIHRHCREQYPPGVRHVLWLMAELAIIGSDIQEVNGRYLWLSAIYSTP